MSRQPRVEYPGAIPEMLALAARRRGATTRTLQRRLVSAALQTGRIRISIARSKVTGVLTNAATGPVFENARTPFQLRRTDPIYGLTPPTRLQGILITGTGMAVFIVAMVLMPRLRPQPGAARTPAPPAPGADRAIEQGHDPVDPADGRPPSSEQR